MKNPALSGFIFELVEEFELFNRQGNINEFTDEAFELFIEKYKVLSKKRDIALQSYLKATPNLFRCNLPNSKWSFAVSLQLVWYYDEVIIADPIIPVLDSDIDIEARKDQLQRMLIILKEAQDCINSGYLLFVGLDIVSEKTIHFEEESKKLVEIPEVVESYENISFFVKKPSPINDNVNDNLTQIEILYEGFWNESRQMGMYIPPHLRGASLPSNSIYFDFIEPYERIKRSDLCLYEKESMLKNLYNEYCKDISVVLSTLVNSQNLNSPTLFFRESDSITAKCFAISNSVSPSQVIADRSVYDCALPYLNNVLPEHLFKIRSDIPNAFKDFRSFLFELVNKTMKATNDPAERKYKIDSEISSMLNRLEVELNNAKRKWEVGGIVTPLILASGSLGLFTSGVDYSSVMGTVLGSGGAAKIAASIVDKKNEQDRASLNPVYFLWKAQQSNV